MTATATHLPQPALSAGRAWLDRHGAGATVLCHHDADGLASGVLLQARTGGPVLHVETPWEGRLSVTGPAILADWGVRPVEGPAHVLYVDHHAEPEPVPGTVVTAAEGGDTSTSLVAWDLLGRPPEGQWLAALGAVGDLGPGAVRAGVAPRAASGSRLAKLASLVTAPGRLRDGPVGEAFALLSASASVEQASDSPSLATLEEARAQVASARERAARTRPVVGRDAALLRFSEPARVHPLVAVAWAKRLAPRVVIAANEGWRDDRISFAVRSAEGVDLRRWLLDRYRPPRDAGDYGRGHARATGGSLCPDAFDEFAEAALR